MKLLLDANISWRLCKALNEQFEEVIHVDQVLNTPSSDAQIWKYALSKGYTIVTNDEDFLNFLNIFGFPPKIVLLKTGNQNNQYVLLLLCSKKNVIQEFVVSDQYGLLEIY
ncbi:MAG: DUF5615 family PIN-like protein [Chitinophagaceae bacterium]|nr:DUF5615 family PIN-like protein [Chitinophagaceae bacterium]